MESIEYIENQLTGIPKQDKILNLKQRIINIEVQTTFPSGQYTKMSEEESLILESLKKLLEEIEQNPEAYNSSISNKKLIPYIFDRSLDWFYNFKNIRNQDLVFATVDHFETGARRGIFMPLDFLNLLWAQLEFIKENIDKPSSILKYLNSIPLTSEEKHILFGFILKWYGGYPVENLDEQYNTTLRLIEREFLKYAGETPEKELCQKDWVKYKRTKQIEKMINDKIGNVTTGLEQPSIDINSKPIFKLSDKKGAKTDLIRILNALYELRLVTKVDGQIPTKQEFIESVGNCLGVDLSNYHSNLSQALQNQPLETNLKIFEEMVEITKKAHFTNK